VNLRRQYKQLGRAWAIKESFSDFWPHRRESSARNFFHGCFHWATHSRLPELVSVAYTIKRYCANIIIYILKRISNAAAEDINSKT